MIKYHTYYDYCWRGIPFLWFDVAADSFCFFFCLILLAYSCFPVFLPYSEIDAPYTYIFPLPLEFLLIQVTTVHEIEVPVLHRMFSSAIQSIHSVNSVCVSAYAFLFLPLPLSSLVPVCSLCFANKIVYTIFLDSHYTLMCDICFPLCVTLGMAVSVHPCLYKWSRGSKIPHMIWLCFFQCVCTKYRYKWIENELMRWTTFSPRWIT